MSMMNKNAKFHGDTPSGKKLNSISRARLNFRRRPIMFVYNFVQKPTQASNFGGTFDQPFLWICLCGFHRRCQSNFSLPWCKKVKNDQKTQTKVLWESCTGMFTVSYVPACATGQRKNHAKQKDPCQRWQLKSKRPCAHRRECQSLCYSAAARLALCKSRG